MVKLTKWLLISLVAVLIIAGCSNDTADDEQPNDNDDSTGGEVVDNGEDPENNDDNNGEEEPTNDDDNEGSETPDTDGELLRLGDTGVMETALGNYEVTPTSFTFVDEMTEDDPIQTPHSETFIVIDFTIVNIGDEPMDSEEIVSSAALENLDGGGRQAYADFPSIDNFDEEIPAGATVEGQLLFDLGVEDEYELSFGSAYVDSLSNEVRWQLFADEAE